MNEVIKTISERRAVRKYNDKPVSKELIEQLLNAGRMAPSAMNRQPWRFYVVTDKAYLNLVSKEIVKGTLKSLPGLGLKKIAKAVVSNISQLLHGFEFLKSDDPVFHGAPLVIFLAAAKDNEWAALDIGMCAQNMMLAAKSLGLESCPVGFGKFIEKTSYYKQLGVPDDEQVLLSIVAGYGDESPKMHKRDSHNAFYKP